MFQRPELSLSVIANTTAPSASGPFVIQFFVPFNTASLGSGVGAGAGLAQSKAAYIGRNTHKAWDATRKMLVQSAEIRQGPSQNKCSGLLEGVVHGDNFQNRKL
mmetsp:Transcript_36714/g.74109  ORF Transcript_36714/g.74109 Transcript_36714/m.74109 type:complete len:104 (-) Transcript_36714:224-535(-)